jgi:hypothetical protein
MSKPSSNIDPLEKKPFKETSPKEINVLGNNKISINYVHIREILDQNKIFINNVFTLSLILASPEVMMKLNHKLLKNVDIEMISQYRKKQSKQS